MEKITSTDDLLQSILMLEIQKANEWQLVKQQFLITYQSLKPVNIIKKTLKDVISAPDFKTNIINAAIGLSTGFIAKKVFIGGSHNPLTKFLGLIMEMVIANKVSKNADGIKSIGNIVLTKILNHHLKSKNING